MHERRFTQCPVQCQATGVYRWVTCFSMLHVRHGTPRRKQDIVEAGAYTVTISQHDGLHEWYCWDDESTILTSDTPYEYPLARV